MTRSSTKFSFYDNNYFVVVLVNSLFMLSMFGMPHILDDKTCALDVWYSTCVCW